MPRMRLVCRHRGRGAFIAKQASPIVVLALVLVMTACSSGDDAVQTTSGLDRFPDVIGVEVEVDSDGTYRFDVTISSPYDSPDRYADAWRVKNPNGTVYGVRELLHDHAGEQPFTRSLAGVEIPDGVERVVVEGRDLENGWGGKTLEVDLGAAREP